MFRRLVIEIGNSVYFTVIIVITIYLFCEGLVSALNNGNVYHGDTTDFLMALISILIFTKVFFYRVEITKALLFNDCLEKGIPISNLLITYYFFGFNFTLPIYCTVGDCDGHVGKTFLFNSIGGKKIKTPYVKYSRFGMIFHLSDFYRIRKAVQMDRCYCMKCGTEYVEGRALRFYPKAESQKFEELLFALKSFNRRGDR